MAIKVGQAGKRADDLERAVLLHFPRSRARDPPTITLAPDLHTARVLLHL